MSITTETKVGALVIAAAIGLGWLSFNSGLIGNSNAKNLRQLESAFRNAEGIVIGSDVKMAGVTVGEVTDISLTSDGTAVIHFTVKKDVPLAANVKAQVASNGLIGEKFLGLTTDFGAQGTLPATTKSIPSAGSASVENIASNFARVSDDLEEITAALRSSLAGPQNTQKLSNIVNGLEGAFTRLDTILNQDLGSNQVSEIVQGLSTTSQNLASITTRLENGEGTLGKLLSEKQSDLIENLTAAAQDLRAITEKINTGEGSLGRLINDPATVEKVETALDNFSAFAERADSFRTEVDFNGYMLPAEGISKGNFSVTLTPRPTRYYVLGVQSDGFVTEAERSDGNPSFRNQDFGDDMKVTAQFGHVFQNAAFGKDLGFRIGLKNGAFGLGLDMNDVNVFNNHTVDLAADIYDFSAENLARDSEENPHIDLTAKLNLIDRTLYAVGGYDNVLSQKYGSPFVGLGFRFQDDDLKYLVSQTGGGGL